MLPLLIRVCYIFKGSFDKERVTLRVCCASEGSAGTWRIRTSSSTPNTTGTPLVILVVSCTWRGSFDKERNTPRVCSNSKVQALGKY